MFNRRLRKARMDAGLTQQATADSVGTSLRNYQSYEQGKRRPTYENLAKLADVLGVTTDYLLGRIGEEPSD